MALTSRLPDSAERPDVQRPPLAVGYEAAGAAGCGPTRVRRLYATGTP